MCPKAQHLNYFGLYRYIRFKDPLEKLTIQLRKYHLFRNLSEKRGRNLDPEEAGRLTFLF